MFVLVQVVDGFSDASFDDIFYDEGNDSMDLNDSEQFNLLNDTGIEADIPDDMPNAPLSLNDNVDDAASHIESTNAPTLNDEPEPHNTVLNERRRKPNKSKLIRDSKIQLTSYVMATRTSNPWVFTRPRRSDIPELHRKKVDELFRLPAHRGSINQRVMAQVFDPRLVQRSEPDWDMLNDILGPSAREVGGEPSRNIRHTTRNRSSASMSLNMDRLDGGHDDTIGDPMPSTSAIEQNIEQRSSLSVFDEPQSMDDSNVFDFGEFDEGNMPRSCYEPISRRTRQTVSNRSGFVASGEQSGVITSNDTESMETKILRKLTALWRDDSRPIRVDDLVDSGSNRIVAAKTFGAILGKSQHEM